MTPDGHRLVLHDGGPLLWADDALLGEVLAAQQGDPEPLSILREELAAYCGLDAPVALFDDLAAARARVARAARVRESAGLLVVGGRTAGIEGGFEAIAFEELARAPQWIADTVGLAGVLLEPRGELAVLRAISEQARRKGVRLVLDESRTASRLTARTVGEEAGIVADAVLVGDSLACGTPFGAVIGLTERESTCAPSTARLLRACLRRLAVRGVHEQLSRRGVALRARFQTACRTHDLKGRLLGPAALMRIAFDPQDNVDADRILARFCSELAALGVDCARDLALHEALDDRQLAVVAAAFERASATLRTRLVEHNATVADDLPFVFAGGSERRRARGLARFLHPRQVAGAVEVVDGGLRLSLAPGPLGPGATAGFLSREPLTGDFELLVRYQLMSWDPGQDGASFAVFVQDLVTGQRSQALRLSAVRGGRSGSLMATFDGHPEGARTAPDLAGWLRIRREGDTLTVAAATDGAVPGPFVELARRRPVAAHDLLAGCRITGQVDSDGLVAEVRAFAVVCPPRPPGTGP